MLLFFFPVPGRGALNQVSEKESHLQQKAVAPFPVILLKFHSTDPLDPYISYTIPAECINVFDFAAHSSQAQARFGFAILF